MWYHVDLIITPTVPRPSGSNRADRLALACVSGRGHPHRPQPHQDLPGAQGELSFKEGINMDPFFSQQSSSRLTMKGISSWFCTAFSLHQQSMLCLLWSSSTWWKQVPTYIQHTIQLTLVFQGSLHSWHHSWMLRAQIPMWSCISTSHLPASQSFSWLVLISLFVSLVTPSQLKPMALPS